MIDNQYYNRPVRKSLAECGAFVIMYGKRTISDA